MSPLSHKSLSRRAGGACSKHPQWKNACLASWKHPYPRRHIQPKFRIPIVAKPTIGQVRLESETRWMTKGSSKSKLANKRLRQDDEAAERSAQARKRIPRLVELLRAHHCHGSSPENFNVRSEMISRCKLNIQKYRETIAAYSAPAADRGEPALPPACRKHESPRYRGC
jgi:hypothetical protein